MDYLYLALAIIFGGVGLDVLVGMHLGTKISPKKLFLYAVALLLIFLSLHFFGEFHAF